MARLARIYPLYALVTLMGLLMNAQRAALHHPASPQGLQALKHLASQLLLASLPIPSISGFWVVAAWSIPIEAVCYALVFPILRALGPRARGTRLLLVVVAVASAAGLIVYVRHFSPVVNGIGFGAAPDPWSYWVPLVRGVSMFVAGWAAYLVYRREPQFARAVGLAADCLAVFAGLIVLGEAFGLIRKQALVLLAPFLIMALMDARSWTARMLSCAPVHGLGVISYSIYLLHLPVYQLTLHVRPGLAGHDVWRIAVPLVLTVVVATASYAGFERPARRLIRGWAGWLTRVRASADTGPAEPSCRP